MDTKNPSEFVRRSCRAVVDRATHVRIHEPAIEAYVRELAAADPTMPGHDPASHYLDGGAGTAAFFLTLDAINFGSGYFPFLRKRPGLSGYFTVAFALADRFRSRGLLAADELATISAAGCAELFGQDAGHPVVGELMARFARALNDLGALLAARYGGSCTALIEAADGSAARLIGLLAEMPYFQDVQLHAGEPVAFYKRAQLAAADLALAFGGAGWGRFDDLANLTIFADNLVPHVLRVDGILVYSSELATRIDSGELIPAGSAEEVELRAAAVTAAELLVAAARRQGLAWTAMDADYRLWNRGQQPYFKQVKPRHRTRTVFY
ncbi:MAG TPA: queuosine salvage family protein [Acidobacteriota bacterium]|nr:queuosine salvage family protein [Acidobacteriota bacterium]HQM61954.1 queuosine salvage family protein [Acidobacteriota bacterium]